MMRSEAFLRCFIPGYTSEDPVRNKKSKKKSIWYKLQRWSQKEFDKFIKDVSREIYGGLALLGIFTLTTGIFVLVCRNKGLIKDPIGRSIVTVTGPVFVVIGVMLFVTSVFVYHREKRKKRICCCSEEDVDNDTYYIEINTSDITNDTSFTSNRVSSKDSDDSGSEEIRSAFRKVSLGQDRLIPYAKPLSSELSCPFQPCHICSDYSAKADFRLGQMCFILRCMEKYIVLMYFSRYSQISSILHFSLFD